MMMILGQVITAMATCFNILAGQQYDKKDPSAPFTLSSMFDASFTLFALLLGLAGYLNEANPQDDA